MLLSLLFVTRIFHTSHLTPHTSHLTPHTSHLTPHTVLTLQCSRFDLVDGRLVLLFSLDSMLPVTSIALLPVDLSTYETLDVAAAESEDSHQLFSPDTSLRVDDDLDDQVELSQFKGRFPFSKPPITSTVPLSHDGKQPNTRQKSYMLMVGYTQVTEQSMPHSTLESSVASFVTALYNTPAAGYAPSARASLRTICYSVARQWQSQPGTTLLQRRGMFCLISRDV